jgi:hypothetical protein
MDKYDRNNQLVSTTWYFKRPVEDGTGTIYYINDQVTAINILTVNTLNLGAFIKKFGEPDNYWAETKHDGDRSYLDVKLFYPSKGYLAEVILDFKSNSDQLEIQESTPIFSVTFFDPNIFEDLLKTKILIDELQMVRSGNFVPWTGFGTIQFKPK